MKALSSIVLLALFSNFLVSAVSDQACKITQAIIDDDKIEVSFNLFKISANPIKFNFKGCCKTPEFMNQTVMVKCIKEFSSRKNSHIMILCVRYLKLVMTKNLLFTNLIENRRVRL